MRFKIYSRDIAWSPAIRVRVRKNKTLKITVVLLLLILALALALRLVNVGHLVSWDEAWNVNSIQDAASGHHSNATTFYPNFFRHPPLYTGLGVIYSKVAGMGRTGLSYFLEIVSILFSLALIVALFLCGRDWFNEWAGLAAAFIFAVMPAARVYDSLVKQESMTLFLGLLFLLFFFRKRYFVAGLFLGLALLTKEIIVFVPAAVFVFVLLSRKWDRLKGFGLSLLIAVPMAAWWYLFLSRTEGQFMEFFLGTHSSAQVWHKPFWSYLARIPGDIGWGGLVALLLGLGALAWHLKTFHGADREHRDYLPRDMALFLLIWVLAIYLVLSVSYGKPPWMVYTALPAFALLGGWGLAETYRALSNRRGTAVVTVVLLVVLIAATAIPFGFTNYESHGDVLYNSTLRDRAVARYINVNGGRGARVMLKTDDLSPIMMFYLDSYASGDIALLSAEPAQDRVGGDKRVLLIDDSATPAQAARHVATVKPSFVVLRSNSDAAAAFSSLVKPYDINGSLIFNGKELLNALLPLLSQK
jgi:4-amino-4-deoxy-L-arabinose transferase-like glycosyltransferase